MQLDIFIKNDSACRGLKGTVNGWQFTVTKQIIFQSFPCWRNLSLNYNFTDEGGCINAHDNQKIFFNETILFLSDYYLMSV